MSDPQKCPKCGAELPVDAPAGLCPKCLVAAGFESQSGIHAEKPKSDPEAPTQASPAPAFTPPEVAEIADRFPQLEILELLGHGGMGAVYKARQKNLDRLVALKIIRPEATHDAAFAERFNREAKTLARLSHQHIVAVHDFGEVEYSEVEGQPARPLYYFLMEFVDGANLRQLMRTERLAPEQALAIVPQICDALQYAHDEGVVHRDIKPENILLDKRGRVKIADFGLAMLTTRSEADFTLTGTHQVMGTLRYMAPEQMEGSHAVDHRADIYSLGVVFYEMLTGEVPAGHFEPPSKKVELDVRLDEVVLRSLAREPERRYQQASNVKTDVESISNTSLKSMGPLERTSDVHDGLSGPRQFSRKAIAGGVLTALFFTLTVPALLGVGAARSAGSSDVGIIVGIIAALILLFCVISGPVGCLLGVVAISDIRHSQGRITGLGLAFFDAVFFPLLVLDSVIMGLGLWIHARLSSPDAVSPWIAILIGLAILFVDALILLPAWRATASSMNRNKVMEVIRSTTSNK